jgi:hypothetical protein
MIIPGSSDQLLLPFYYFYSFYAFQLFFIRRSYTPEDIVYLGLFIK